ncbi:transposase [Stenotrophomonas sp. NPDC077659]|uniref:transposase n=1 Tax=Stenotrophomonas sp. NPDC077659 TaxID=3390694 RepID=UPI003CFD0669
MARYSDELKNQIVGRMMPPRSQSVAEISRDTGISAPTLYAWKRQSRNEGKIVPSKPTSADGWDARSKLAAIVQTAAMNEAERSAWCRSKGLYPEQLDAWKQAFESMEVDQGPVSRAESTVLRKRMKQLEKELLRKDRALAEAAALLTLSKKAQAIWGTGEDA